VSEQSMDLRTSARAVRRHKILVGVLLLLGLVAGGGYRVAKPPMMSSTALVVLPGSVRSMATQVVISQSDPVLAGAASQLGSTLSPQTLLTRVQVKSLTSNILSVTGQGRTAKQAEQIANAVANSYIAYVGSPTGPTGQLKARVLEPAATATGMTLTTAVVIAALLGAMVGAAVGAVTSIVVSRRDRRLRFRDEIADAIGVAVLASIQVSHPSDPGGWTRLLEHYDPSAVDTLRLHNALDQLGLADRRGGTGASVSVISLSGDRGALAIGPQLAAFAANLGIPTALAYGPQQDLDSAATLRAACAALAKESKPLGNLWVTVRDHGSASGLADVGLTVIVSVVDRQSPSVAMTMRATQTVLGVSSGVATAEQLARVATSAVADNRYLAGIIVADPDPADRTTGRLPQVSRAGRRRMPTRAVDRSVGTGS